MMRANQHACAMLYAMEASITASGADAKARRLDCYQQVVDLVVDPYAPPFGSPGSTAPCSLADAQAGAQALIDAES